MYMMVKLMVDGHGMAAQVFRALPESFYGRG